MFPKPSAFLGLAFLFFSALPWSPKSSAVEPSPLEAGQLLRDCQTILFLGDSITFSGQYVTYVEAGLRLAFPARADLQILNLGLSSETVSGLSEDGHAGGKFPRPDLHERLERILKKTKPDVVFACYGMNDGIYLPIETSRFDAFKNGIRKLHELVKASGAKIIHVTPPSFDPGPDAKPDSFNYNQTLDAYSTWLIEQKPQGWNIIDLHFPMNRELEARRKSEPQFQFAKDHIHPNSDGHWVMAREILAALSIPVPDQASFTSRTELLSLIGKRSDLLKLAWLTETGHLRPGVTAGLPLSDATAAAAPLTEKVQALLSQPAH